MNLEVGKRYTTRDKTYICTATKIEGDRVWLHWIAREGAGDYGIDMTNFTDGRRIDGSSRWDLTEEYIIPKVILLCNCIWNKHPAYCKCK